MYNSFVLPGLRERPEDIAPNLDYELERVGAAMNRRLTVSREARERYLGFARSPEALWAGNFRDFGASMRRMATLCEGGRIGVDDVEQELERLRALWRTAADPAASPLEALLGARLAAVDRFDRVQLEEVVRVCRSARTLSDAGRTLFAASRTEKTHPNDADRLRKYLARYGLTFQANHAA